METPQPKSIEDVARAGYLSLCSSLNTTPHDLLSFLTSIQSEFLTPSHRLWVCGSCGVGGICLEGKELKRLRGERGLSLGEMAGRVGVSVPYLSQIERGKRRPSRKVEEGYEAGEGGR